MSKHSLSELAAGSLKYGPAAEDLARTYAELPYYPLGVIDDLLGTISELAGTFDDIRMNERTRVALGSLAKQGTDLRDRGALIDALRANASFFVTSDKGMVGKGPRLRIEGELPIRIRTPAEMCADLLNSPGETNKILLIRTQKRSVGGSGSRDSSNSLSNTQRSLSTAK